MNERSLPALIVLNLVLLLAVVLVGLSPQPAQGQGGFGSGGGDYVMVAGAVRGRENQSAIYVVDLRSSRMAVGFFNSSNNSMDWIAARVVSDDLRTPSRR